MAITATLAAYALRRSLKEQQQSRRTGRTSAARGERHMHDSMIRVYSESSIGFLINIFYFAQFASGGALRIA